MADAALGRTRLHGPHDGVDHGLLRRRVDEVDGVADRDHFRPAPARFIDHLDVAQEQVELLDASFDEGLLVLRVLILGVLRAVAELRGPLDPQGDLAALRRPQVPQFRLELIAALLGQKRRWWLGRAVTPHKCPPVSWLGAPVGCECYCTRARWGSEGHSGLESPQGNLCLPLATLWFGAPARGAVMCPGRSSPRTSRLGRGCGCAASGTRTGDGSSRWARRGRVSARSPYRSTRTPRP